MDHDLLTRHHEDLDRRIAVLLTTIARALREARDVVKTRVGHDLGRLGIRFP